MSGDPVPAVGCVGRPALVPAPTNATSQALLAVALVGSKGEAGQRDGHCDVSFDAATRFGPVLAHADHRLTYIPNREGLHGSFRSCS